MRASSGVIVKKSPLRHGEILVEAVTVAIMDIDHWLNRLSIKWKADGNSLRLRLKIADLRRNAQLADAWFCGQFESLLTFKECCELLDQEHEVCLRGVYTRWTIKQIEELRSARPRTDWKDIGLIYPNAAHLLFSEEDIEEAEIAEDAMDVDDDGLVPTATEGQINAGIKPQSAKRRVDRRRRVREPAGQGVFAWGDDSSPTDPDQNSPNRPELCPARD